MPGTIRTAMAGRATVVTLVDGDIVTFVGEGMPLPATVWARPAAGDTVAVTYSTDNGVNWQAWPIGPVTAYAQDVLLSGVTHVRFQRTAGTGTTSTCGVC
jgi:hypothetical protein